MPVPAGQGGPEGLWDNGVLASGLAPGSLGQAAGDAELGRGHVQEEVGHALGGEPGGGSCVCLALDLGEGGVLAVQDLREVLHPPLADRKGVGEDPALVILDPYEGALLVGGEGLDYGIEALGVPPLGCLLGLLRQVRIVLDLVCSCQLGGVREEGGECP